MEFSIEIGKKVLLEALNNNKTRYVDTREVLVKVYEEKSAEYQAKYTEYSQKVVDGTLTDDDRQPSPPYIPEDRGETYDWYIAMVTAHCDDTLEIEDKMFRRLFLDKWTFITEHISALSAWASNTISADSTSTSAALLAYTG